jgi:hypothetical protein
MSYLLHRHAVAINEMIKLELLEGTRTEPVFNKLKKRLDSLRYFESTGPLWDFSAKLSFNLRWIFYS